MTVKSNEIILNRYQIIRLLGSGGFGAVYLANDQRLNRTVAIKEMDVARLVPEERIVAAHLFEQEARMLAALDHPGLTRIWDFFEHQQRAFLVMEYIPGQTLRDVLIQNGGSLPEEMVLDCALQLCAVLSYLHAQSPPVIFRDLKPANVMVMDDPRATNWDTSNTAIPIGQQRYVLIDFGIARLFKPEQSSDTLIIGTPGYAPPEQYGQGQTDVRSDIYSLGATLYHLLSYQMPKTVPPPLLTQVAPDLARVVARATAVDPHQRYQHVTALRRDLQEIVQARRHTAPTIKWTNNIHSAHEGVTPLYPRPTTQLPPAPTYNTTRPRQTPTILLLLVVIMLIGIIAIGGIILGTFTGPSLGAQASPTAPTSASQISANSDWLLPGAPGRILFGQYTGDVAYNLTLGTLDGQAPQTLTSSGSDFGGAISPDGRKIAFARVTARDKQSVIMIGDIGQFSFRTIPLSQTNNYARYPTWSPDGKQIAFATASSRSGIFRLAVFDIANGQISYPGPDQIGWITWDSHGLTYAARSSADQAQDLFVLAPDGTIHNLTNTADIEEEFPAWSPDGSTLTFVASPAGTGHLAQRQIFAINANGRGRRQLTSGPGAHTNPVWSPDGAWIAYLYQAPESSTFQIWVMRADGSAARPLTSDTSDKFYLCWSQ